MVLSQLAQWVPQFIKVTVDGLVIMTAFHQFIQWACLRELIRHPSSRSSDWQGPITRTHLNKNTLVSGIRYKVHTMPLTLYESIVNLRMAGYKDISVISDTIRQDMGQWLIRLFFDKFNEDFNLMHVPYI